MKILAIRGVLDSTTGHRFERSLMDLLREHREPIGLDFSGLKYMTSAGVASFLRVSQKARERNLKLGILSPSQEVGMMLDFLGISRHIPVYPSEHEMRAAMPEAVQPLDVVEQYSMQPGTYQERSDSADRSTGVKGGILPPSGMASSSSGSASAGAHTDDAFQMGQSMGRLSETLDGLTRHLKSLGKTMEDLQRTEHSLKEEFEKDRAVRSRSEKSGEDTRSFDLSATSKLSGSSRNRDKGVPRPGARGPAEVPVASMKHQASAAMSGRSGVSASAQMSGSQPAEMNRILECEQCGSKLRIYHAGRHLCPACKIEFEVETDGSTSYYEKLAT
ncbi:MAG: STAS domain-containing protein [Leptospiraceae bacterium]